jgi:hypothetical protein
MFPQTSWPEFDQLMSVGRFQILRLRKHVQGYRLRRRIDVLPLCEWPEFDQLISVGKFQILRITEMHDFIKFNQQPAPLTEFDEILSRRMI